MSRYDCQTNDEKVGSIYRTKDYSKFKFNKYNRKIDEPHLQTLMTNIRLRKAVIEPIQVDSQFNIVDGQHRLVACQRLGLPVDYFVDTQTKVIDADLLNSKAKSWSLMTYIQRGVSIGDPDYIKLYRQILKWGGVFSPSMIAEFYSKSHHSPTSDIKSRSFVFNENPTADSFLEALSKQLKYQKTGLTKNLIRALFTWYNKKDVDQDRLIKVIDRDLLINHGTSMASCLAAVGKKYNYNLTAKRRINYYVTAQNQFFFDA